MEEQRGFKFRKREIILIFLLLLIGGAVIFSLGIKVGQSMFSKATSTPEKDDIKLKSMYETAENYEDNKLPEKSKPEAAVAVEPVKEKPKTDELGIKEVTEEIKGKFTVQISAYQTEDEAKKAASELYGSGYKLAYYMETNIPGKGVWYRVGIGFFKQKTSAETFAETLKKQGKITSYLIRKID